MITLCGHAAENCSIFPGIETRLHWGLEDPAEIDDPVLRLRKFRERNESWPAEND